MQATVTTSQPATGKAAGASAPVDVESIDVALDVAARHATERPYSAAPTVPLPAQAAGDTPDIDLSNAPALKPVKKLRARQRVALYRGMMDLNDRLKNNDRSEDGSVAVTVNDLDVIADIEELLERYAADPDAYAEWVTEEGGGPDPDARVVALFSQYAEQLGESAPSTT